MQVVMIGKGGNKQTLDLQVPASLTLRYELIGARVSALRMYAACLAACWPRYDGKAGKTRTFAACGHNVGEYGGRACDYFFEQGVTAAVIMDIGADAHGMIVESIPDVEEVKRATGNSEGEAESPEPSATNT